MSKIKFKPLILSSIVCLLPIILGVYVYDKLPNPVPIHFDINNNPNGYAPRAFFVFLFPVLMLLLQTLCCVITDINAYHKGPSPKLEIVSKSIIPFLTFVLYPITIFYALGVDIDIRKVACLLIGLIFISFGFGFYNTDISYMNLSTIKIKNEKSFLKVKKISTCLFSLLGIMFIISIFFPPIYSIVVLILLFLFAIFISVYSFYLSRK